MQKDTSITTVRVFVNNQNQFGSPLGVVVDKDQMVSAEDRQKIATRLNYSETVFIDDVQKGVIQVFSPIRECPFSMYAAVGTAWYIKNKLNAQIDHLVSRNQKIDIQFQDGKTWATSRVTILPNWNLAEYKTTKEIESFSVHEFKNKEHVLVWAWINAEKGLIRARTFAADWGIPEDEANGSGSMRLAALLQRDITVIHGKGSVIFAEYSDKKEVWIGGRCIVEASIF